MPKTLADLVRVARTRIHEISAEELDEMIEDHADLLIVDAREPHESARGHIPGSLLVPRDTLEAAADASGRNRIDRLCHARAGTVVLYSDRGERSALAADTLQHMGYASVYSLAGGIERWKAAGLPVITD